MTATDKVARRKLSLLDLAKDLDNVSRACRVMGYSGRPSRLELPKINCGPFCREYRVDR